MMNMDYYKSYLDDLSLNIKYSDIISVRQEIDENLHLMINVLQKSFDQSILNVSIMRYCKISAELLLLDQLLNEKPDLVDSKQVSSIKEAIEAERTQLRVIIKGKDDDGETKRGGYNPYSFDKFDKKFVAFSV